MQGKLGIVAGGGGLPRRLVELALADGLAPHVVALTDQTEVRTVAGVPHAWFRLGQISQAVDWLHHEGVVDLVMIGPVARPGLKEMMPDPRAFKFLSKAAFKALGDDGLLRAIIRTLEEEEGFRVHGADEFLSDLLAREGAYGELSPDQQASRDIDKGLTVLRSMGSLDIGQAVVVQQGLVLGIEAIEGTDALLERCGALRRDGPGGVLVKARKPGQEHRVDLPTIGPETVNLAGLAGLRGIAVEASSALVVDEERLVAAADAGGLFVLGVPAIP